MTAVKRVWVPSMTVSLPAAAALGFCVVAAIDAFLNTADALAADVNAALAWVPPVPPATDGGIDLIHVCFAYSDLIRGHQIALLVFLLGGIPCAVIGRALDRGRRDGRGCGPGASGCLHAGLVFQVCCLGWSGFLFVALTVGAALLEPSAIVNPFSAILLLLAACNAWGLTTWCEVQQDRRVIALRLAR